MPATIHVQFTKGGRHCGALLIAAWEVDYMISYARRMGYAIALERVSDESPWWTR